MVVKPMFFSRKGTWTVLIMVLSFIFLFLVCCNTVEGENRPFGQQSMADVPEDIPLRYARRFTLKRVGASTLIDVVKPAGAKLGVSYRYLLVPRGESVPEGFPEALVVSTPVERVTCGIGLHITMLRLLGEFESIVGVGKKEWIGNETILERIDSRKVLETGLSGSMNMETMVNLSPDIAFVYSSGSDTDVHEKLEAMGIKPGLSSMHLEGHPLGVLEWIKFFGAFFGKSDDADAYFADAAFRYETLERQVGERFGKRPGVIVGQGKRGFWSTHGSSAWFVRLLHDAGANYILEESTDYEENPISFEHAMKIGLVADYWINPLYTATSIADIINSDSRYTHFFSVKEGNVYNNNAATFDSGRNMFWEIGMSEPDAVLRDLVHIFHPEILPVHRLKYYRRLH